MTNYYVISSEYVGPNSDGRHLNAGRVYICTQPARKNMSNEICTDGWCGTTNDVSVYAHGVYGSIEEARDVVRARFEIRDVEVDGAARGDYSAVEAWGIGRDEQMDAESSSMWVQDVEVTALTTDEGISVLVDEANDLCEDEGFALDTDAATKYLTETRNDLLARVLDTIPGYAAEVFGGFVWITEDGVEQRWSKRATRAECERVVVETVDRLGVESAFA